MLGMCPTSSIRAQLPCQVTARDSVEAVTELQGLSQALKGTVECEACLALELRLGVLIVSRPHLVQRLLGIVFAIAHNKAVGS